MGSDSQHGLQKVVPEGRQVCLSQILFLGKHAMLLLGAGAFQGNLQGLCKLLLVSPDASKKPAAAPGKNSKLD